jgi:hypothetical protein
MEPHTAPPGDAWRLGKGPFIFSGVAPPGGGIELPDDAGF